MNRRPSIHTTNQNHHSQQSFFLLWKKITIVILLILVSKMSFAQDMASTPPTTPSPWLQKMNERRPMRFRNDTIMVKPRWFIPDHYKLQYAGNIGFMSIGAGYNIRDRYEPSLYVGLLNETFGDSYTSVVTISLKNSFNLVKQPLWHHLYPKAGLSVNWGYTNNTFNELPAHYPNKYYFQNKIHLAPFMGCEWHQPISDKNLKAVGIYFEFGTLGAYLLECIRTQYIGFTDIWNLALGVSFYIH